MSETTVTIRPNSIGRDLFVKVNPLVFSGNTKVLLREAASYLAHDVGLEVFNEEFHEVSEEDKASGEVDYLTFTLGTGCKFTAFVQPK